MNYSKAAPRVGLWAALLMILFYVAVMDSGLTQKFRGGALAFSFCLRLILNLNFVDTKFSFFFSIVN